MGKKLLLIAHMQQKSDSLLEISMQTRMMCTTASLEIMCMLLIALHLVNCVIWKKYETVAAYTDKMCSVRFVDRALIVPSQLQCLQTCSVVPQCMAIIYHKDKETCFSLKKGFELDDCSAVLVGAKMYKKHIKVVCPEGWTMVHQACYRITKGKHPREQMKTVCKALNDTANLAVAQTKEEMDSVYFWMKNIFLTEYNGAVWFSAFGMGTNFTCIRKTGSGSVRYSGMCRGGSQQGLCKMGVQRVISYP